MNLIKKYKLEILVLAVLTIIYFASRFFNILSLPIFTDEAIYIRWAQIAKQDANWRFISLTDGKQPMFIWLMMVSLRFIQDPLLAGRIVSVGAGFFSLIGMYFLGREIFKNNQIGLISSALYVVFPMSLVYDRMALYDSLVGTFAIWGFLLIVLLVRTIRLDVALILGMLMGAGVLNKTNAFFNIYLLPLSLILFSWTEKNIKKRLIKWLGLAVVTVILSYSFYSILRLSPFFHIINEKNAIFVYSLKDWTDHPFNFFIGNWKAFWDWLTIYLTYPLLLLIPVAFFITRAYFREKLVLFIWFLAPVIALALFGRTLYPRFIFFMTLFLLPLIAISLFNLHKLIKRKWLFSILLLLFFILALRSDYLILTDFSKSPITYSDVSQYSNDWTAGGGIREAVALFKEEAKKGKIYIATQGTFGLLPFALEIYLVDNSNVTIEGFWPLGDVIPKKVLEQSKQIPTYFVFYQPCPSCWPIGAPPATWNLTNKVLEYKKVYSYTYFRVYKVE